MHYRYNENDIGRNRSSGSLSRSSHNNRNSSPKSHKRSYSSDEDFDDRGDYDSFAIDTTSTFHSKRGMN